MAYRRTNRVIRRLAARRDAILAAARVVAADGGIAAVQIASVAAHAGIATGTVYRYFPSKAELVAELVETSTAGEVAAMQQAADAAPGPLSALAAAIATFSSRMLANRKLHWALIGESAGAEDGFADHAFRKAVIAEFERRIGAATASGLLAPDHVQGLAAPALAGALIQGLIGPMAPTLDDHPARQREAVQALTLMALRALGVPDARARGLVVQCASVLATEDAA